MENKKYGQQCVKVQPNYNIKLLNIPHFTAAKINYYKQQTKNNISWCEQKQ